jgi:uncharacterized protein with HEPN domain
MPRDRDSLLDIIESASIAIDLIGAKTADELEDDVLITSAVCYRFIVIGEAATRVSDETQQRYPQLPWSYMRGMRNFVAHQYDDVDFQIVLKTVREDLPSLITEIQGILAADWPTE